MLRKFRKPSALLLVAIISLHGALELWNGFSPPRAASPALSPWAANSGPDASPDFGAGACFAPKPAASPAASGCCAPKAVASRPAAPPARSKPACSCCGESCRGGESCKCGTAAAPKPARRGGGLLNFAYEPLPCHPNAAGAAMASLAPASAEFRFLTPALNEAHVSETAERLIVAIVVPVSPPPVSPPEPPPDSLHAAAA